MRCRGKRGKSRDRPRRRDLVGPLPQDVAPGDADLQTERLSEPPSSWYLTGFIAPVDEGAGATADDPDSQEETETDAGDLVDDDPATAEAADDDSPPEAPATRRRYMPSSIGMTVLVPEAAQAVDVRVTWGDYVTEPPLPTSVLISASTRASG